MLTELNSKGGCLCEPARKGEIRCPLIVRPTSEDVVTGQLFGVLKVLNPRWWLPDFLNRGLGTDRFRRQVFRKFRVDVWQKQRSYPRHQLPWDEGQTEVDVVITWENPATTVFIEMKYGSALSATTIHNDGNNGFPSDQLIRNARVGLWENGWFDEKLLFDIPTRDFVLMLVTPTDGNPLVRAYRQPERLRAAIPQGDKLSKLPPGPFIGELSYQGIVQMLKNQRKWLTRTERSLVDDLTEYLGFKVRQLRGTNGQGHG